MTTTLVYITQASKRLEDRQDCVAIERAENEGMVIHPDLTQSIDVQRDALK
ncbi:MAG: hypothetical protein OQL16_02220 [Gammaproteobacteria bacterium]|nr:hypothetical protein [Gammaproteobacteria bacterium]